MAANTVNMILERRIADHLPTSDWRGLQTTAARAEKNWPCSVEWAGGAVSTRGLIQPSWN
ncbi:hypothetical protein [Humibacillus xanthopallidus]|uniref:hypothetical protein n=1 Tax=Humibacillus xanthopallidus TaxID=412689 RepID=UPI0011542623|nr:hypothetical protein [Humibacillus xanthopallidus]